MRPRKLIAFAIWAAVSLVVMTLITLPISLQTHLIAGAAVVAAMMVLKTLRPHGTWRLIALALGTSVVLRYVYWRTTSTLPPINEPQNFLPGLLVYLAEMYNVGMLGLSLFVVAMPLPSRLAPRLKDDELPTVDVFVPSYNEDRDLLARTLAAAKAIEYPPDKLTVILLDDGGTEQKRNSNRLAAATEAQHRHADLQKLCADLGVQYLTRARNEQAKAGNLNNGLAHSTGELVVVFDADHAPARDFLDCTVGFFRTEPRLFFVQTPHFFLNPDPIERNLRTFLKMPSENEMFYGIIQRGLDKWNASFFCGSAAVLRRSALAETNGFQGRSITEDCESALELHALGWHSIYVDKPLIAGLQPASIRKLHSAAFALVAGHDTDSVVSKAVHETRSHYPAAPLLSFQHAHLVLPRRKDDLSHCPTLLSLLRLTDFYVIGLGVSGLYAVLHDCELDDAKLPLWGVSLALDF